MRWELWDGICGWLHGWFATQCCLMGPNEQQWPRCRCLYIYVRHNEGNGTWNLHRLFKVVLQHCLLHVLHNYISVRREGRGVVEWGTEGYVWYVNYCEDAVYERGGERVGCYEWGPCCTMITYVYIMCGLSMCTSMRLCVRVCVWVCEYVQVYMSIWVCENEYIERCRERVFIWVTEYVTVNRLLTEYGSERGWYLCYWSASQSWRDTQNRGRWVRWLSSSSMEVPDISHSPTAHWMWYSWHTVNNKQSTLYTHA